MTFTPYHMVYEEHSFNYSDGERVRKSLQRVSEAYQPNMSMLSKDQLTVMHPVKAAAPLSVAQKRNNNRDHKAAFHERQEKEISLRKGLPTLP